MVAGPIEQNICNQLPLNKGKRRSEKCSFAYFVRIFGHGNFKINASFIAKNSKAGAFLQPFGGLGAGQILTGARRETGRLKVFWDSE
jgi:hypothetical protein